MSESAYWIFAEGFFIGFGLLGGFFALEKTTGTAGFPDGLEKYLPGVISQR